MEKDESLYILPTDGWQKVPVTIPEFEQFVPRDAGPRFRAKWESIKSQIVEGDALWIVCSPKQDWNAFAGFEALSHCRNGTEINQLVICRS